MRAYAEAATAGIPVLVVSTSPRLLERAQEQAARYGKNRYLIKPFGLEEILKNSRTDEARAFLAWLKKHHPQARMTGSGACVFAEFETNLRRERQLEGIAQAKAKGYALRTYVSSKATVWPDLALGENCFILEQNVIQPFARISPSRSFSPSGRPCPPSEPIPRFAPSSPGSRRTASSSGS